MPRPTKITVDPSSPKFDTIDQAAKALSEKFGATSRNINEQAGVLFKSPDGKFQYSTGIGGSDDNFALAAQIPDQFSLAGIVHTHPGQTSDSQVFSPHDLDVANQLKLPSYVRFLKDGSTRKYIPGTTATQQFRQSGSMPTKVAHGDALDDQTPAPAANAAPDQSTVNVSGSELGSTGTALSGSSVDPEIQSVLGTGLNLGGIGLGAYNQQQQYGVLQNALNTIGPTALNGYTLGGPGGMSSGYNQNGQGTIGLGSLNPAFGNFAGAAGAGSGSYNPSLLANLTGNANSTLGNATSLLGGAYGNYGSALGAANTQLGALNQTYGQVYNNTLGSLQAQQQPQVQQQAFGLQNTLFGRGTLDTTGAGSGAIAAGNFGSQVNAMNAQDALTAQQQALGAQAAGVQNYAGLTNSANGLLSNAFNNFGNTNQLISGLNTAQLNNSLSAVQGAGALNTLGLNNYQAALGTGAAQATARNQSLFPYASTAQALAGTPNALSALADGFSQAGTSIGGNNPLGSLFNGSLWNSSNPFGTYTSNNIGNVGQIGGSSIMNSYGGIPGLQSQNFSAFAPTLQNIGVDDVSSNLGDLGGSLFNSAGGEAANNLQNIGVDAVNVSPDVTSGINSAAGGVGLLGSVGGAFGLAGDLSQGGVVGDTKAATSAAQLGGQAGIFGASSPAIAGLAGAIGIGLAPALIGMSTPAVSLGAQYWNNLNQGLQAPRGSSQYNNSAMELAATMTNDPSELNPGELNIARQYGITPLAPTVTSAAPSQWGFTSSRYRNQS